ncbi:hypothetical protein P6F26_13930 [Roseibacterium sp. SDUM158017]|uniref:hypothetical protein n=1 Tax=Roseicyclus salinarum TaxID=3036773 RepID=UPI002415924E|nr:hypothetical protein [Roseibacterium sp. SDUM158017]MDG4649538.1 hypothetical protein [Roseibacterium sp. SDUM158017]
MDHHSLDAFRADRTPYGSGPFAVVICEDPIEIDTTLGHVARLGFRAVFLVAAEGMDAPAEGPGLPVHVIRDRPRRPDMAMDIVNAVIAKVPGEWVHYCYNGEYLFYPFCEDRSVGEMASWVMEERRDAVLTFVVDLYAADLSAHPDGVSLETAMFDAAGYYAETRRREPGGVMERQLDFHGGLRWRFEEHVAEHRRRIDRVGLFRAKPGLRLRDDHTLNDEEMNTYECRWHHSLTGAICSFRAAKALRTNPGSRYEVHDFRWHGSTRFDWSSLQLMELGLMEPGQWF